MAERSARRVRTGSGIRIRTTAIAVLVVGVSLVLASIALVVLVQRSLRDDVRRTTLLRAQAVASGVETVDRDFVADEADEEFIQVLHADGSLLAASPNLEGEGVLVRLAPGEERIVDHVPVDDGPFLAIAVSARGAGELYTVIVGRSLETVTEATSAIVGVLSLAIPMLLLVVGVVTWLVVGRVLAPVEAIRREVEAISPIELHRRVPDPPGRDEIARLAGTMNAMLARLEEGHERERRLVADASHELRSPIASIRQHAEVAIAHPEASSPTEVAETVLQEALRLQRIVDDLLLLARLDEGSPRPSSEPVDLDDLVFDEARRVRTSTSLRIDVHGVSGGRVLGNRTELDRLVRNLMDNAIRHGRAVVELSLREELDRVVLVVEDDGPGVPEGERSRVFERFVRLDDARGRDAGGSGLGLAIVHDVAAAHGATVRVLDGDLGGARFEVAFPAVDGPPRRSGSFSGRSAADRHATSHPDDDPATGPGGDDES